MESYLLDTLQEFTPLRFILTRLLLSILVARGMVYREEAGTK